MTEAHQYPAWETGFGARRKATRAAIPPPPAKPARPRIQLRLSVVRLSRSLLSASRTSCLSTAVAFRLRAIWIASIPSFPVKSSLAAIRVFSAAGRNPLGELATPNSSLISLIARPTGSLGGSESARVKRPCVSSGSTREPSTDSFTLQHHLHWWVRQFAIR
jgi:hypothetical protein